MTDRVLINPAGQSTEDVVDFIMESLYDMGEEVVLPLREDRLVEHPGHASQKVHGRKGGASEVTGRVSEQGVSAANAVIAGGTGNVSSADLDDAMLHLAANAPPRTNLMNLNVEGKMVTGDRGMPIERKDMPQFDGDVKAQFVRDVEAGGTKVTRESVDPASLTPGQNEIDAGKTGGMFKAIDEGKMSAQDPIIVSSDNRVIDGNHRFAALSAARQDGHPEVTIEILRVDMPAAKLLPLAQTWTTSHGVESRALGT